ncbi:MAG: polysaccharide deacetylase family protein [Polyangiaceae bacterium]
MPPVRLALHCATGALLGLTIHAVLVRPPPVGYAAAAMLGYTALVLAGVLVLPLRVYADAIVRGPRGARGVALTFDDGPHPRWTRVVLAVLAERGARATFFLVARKAEQHPDVVREILERGHAVEVHSYAHDRLFALRGERRVRDDLERAVSALERLTGRRPGLFRPPVGHTNPVIARVAGDLDLTIVGWSARGFDGLSGARSERVVARVRRGLRPGAIVLLHDSPENGDSEPPGVRALPAVLDDIAARGLEVVPLSAWIDAPD